MENREIAEILDTIGKILDIQGENPFKVRAYTNASRTIEGLTTPIAEILREGKLGDLPGIGSGLQEKITELIQTGKMAYFDEVRSTIPPGVIDLLRIPSCGPKKVKVLWHELGINSATELEDACINNKLVALRGFGKKTQDKILEGLKLIARFSGHKRLGDALPITNSILSRLKECKDIERISVAGSMRRWKEVVKDIDIVASSEHQDRVMKHFLDCMGGAEILASGETKSSVRLREGLQVDFRVVADSQFPAALVYFTGSKEHNVALRSRALKIGLKINEYGVFKGSKALECATEEALYKLIDLEYVPPELRENAGEIDVASKGALPKIISAADLKGVLHNHSTWSDGTATIEQMAEKARSMGYQYFGLSDHSKAAGYANGLNEKRLRDQMKEVEKLNTRWKEFKILHGMELDILPDGSLDLSEEYLEKLDFAIGSIHSRFEMSEAEMTHRVCKALSHKYLTMLGHPTGRLLLSRDGFKVDLGQVIDTAKKHGKVLELNANPHRLDLDWNWARRAKEAGVMLSINPDAHSTQGIEDVAYGIGTARRAWLEPAHVLNTRSLEEIRKLLK